MTVAELIAALSEYQSDLQVAFADYEDEGACDITGIELWPLKPDSEEKVVVLMGDAMQ